MSCYRWQFIVGRNDKNCLTCRYPPRKANGSSLGLKSPTRIGFELGVGIMHIRPEPDSYTYVILKNFKNPKNKYCSFSFLYFHFPNPNHSLNCPPFTPLSLSLVVTAHSSVALLPPPCLPHHATHSSIWVGMGDIPLFCRREVVVVLVILDFVSKENFQ